MFEDNGFALVYQSLNAHKRSSVCRFSIASRHPEAWANRSERSFSCIDPKGSGPEPYIGCRAIPNWAHRLRRLVRDALAAADPAAHSRDRPERRRRPDSDVNHDQSRN
jgi:hypothetical protein